MIESKLLTFQKKIEHVKKVSQGVPKIIDIDLADAAIDREYSISGNIFYIYSAPSTAEYVGIKVNETREPMINYTVHVGLITPYYRLYITTPAGQTGTIQLIYGTESPELLQILDHRSTTVAGVGGILDELRGDTTPENYGGVTVGAAAVLALAANAARKACWFHSLSTNANSIFLGFTNAVTAGGAPGTWFAELLPGVGWGVDDYRGDIYAIAGGAGQVLGVGEW